MFDYERTVKPWGKAMFGYRLHNMVTVEITRFIGDELKNKPKFITELPFCTLVNGEGETKEEALNCLWENLLDKYDLLCTYKPHKLNKQMRALMSFVENNFVKVTPKKKRGV